LYLADSCRNGQQCEVCRTKGYQEPYRQDLKMETKQLVVDDPDLATIKTKVLNGQRLSLEDGMALYDSPDLLGVGALAHHARLERHGRQAFYIFNQHLNYTNVCSNRCVFCAYAKDEGEKGHFTLSLQEVAAKLRERLAEPIHEVHVVGGLNPALPFDYYIELLETIRAIRPEATIKAFTPVEIDHLAQLGDLSIEQVIESLKAAGLAMMPGGGAEVMSDRIHQKLYPRKIGGKRWLQIMEAVHGAGIGSNATMLYGHIETKAERVQHLIDLRQLQDKTGGFSAFIPLAFHSQNTPLNHIPATTAFDDLKTIAIARLMLDNFDHIKAYWIMLGAKLAQVALAFGADDLDGTILEEKITHMAGATSAQAMTARQIKGLIRAAGFSPVQRDSYYHSLEESAPAPPPRPPAIPSSKALAQAIETVEADRRLDAEQALALLEQAELHTLGRLANQVCRLKHPQPVVTYVVDRNINYTNVCVSECRFCAFHRSAQDPDAYVISEDELAQKIEETLALGGTQILLQGGMHPELGLDYYHNLLSFIKSRFAIHIHGFSPPEIAHLAQKEDCSLDEIIAQLKAAGLDSIPGGGAEILVEDVRRQLSPHKCSARRWLEVMACAHGQGLKTTATMMFGHIETAADIVNHLIKIRQLQEQTGGFTAFIPWSFQPGNTQLKGQPATAAEYLRVLAVSRLVLDNIDNIQASWVTQGAKIAQTALFFGANDMGSTMIEENVVAAAGVAYRLSRETLDHLIESAGFRPQQRDCFYRPISIPAQD
jgi:aminodeoxyfutalosine synthase